MGVSNLQASRAIFLAGQPSESQVVLLCPCVSPVLSECSQGVRGPELQVGTCNFCVLDFWNVVIGCGVVIVLMFA